VAMPHQVFIGFPGGASHVQACLYAFQPVTAVAITSSRVMPLKPHRIDCVAVVRHRVINSALIVTPLTLRR
jgi:hypothetical protein